MEFPLLLCVFFVFHQILAIYTKIHMNVQKLLALEIISPK